MAPPTFKDLGKPSRDLFSKGFHQGFLKVETTSKPHDEFELKLVSSHNLATSKLFGSIEAKYKIKDLLPCEATLTEKWNTDNTLSTEIKFEDCFAKGCNLTLDSAFTPQMGKRSGKLKLAYVHERAHLNADVALEGGPLVSSAAVIGFAGTKFEGCLVGVEGAFDTQRNKLTHTSLAAGYEQKQYGFHAFVSNSKEFGGHAYHRVNNKVELAANAGWTTGEQSTRFGVATKVAVTKDWTVQARLSNNSQVAFSTAHQLNKHVKMTASALVDVPKFNEANHKFGVGFEYKPCC